MRKIILLSLVLLAGYIVFASLNSRGDSSVKNSDEIKNEEISNDISENTDSNAITSKSVFVPYWTVGSLNPDEVQKYDKLIYFGVAANEQGIDKSESGYSGLSTFSQSISGKKTLLTLRMLDTESNLKILQDSKLQEKIMSDLIVIVDEYGFDGVVLDLELSVLSFTDVKDNISMFVRSLSEKLDENNLDFAMTIYGDTYFRGRPYDIKDLEKYVDEFMIMAYDFHKSYGEPGPNFPLTRRSLGEGGRDYGYDFKKMIDDFSKDVESEKLTVVFGMFGYDWTLGKQGKPLKRAEAKTLLQINDIFYPQCNLKNCLIKKDAESAETKIEYVDDEDYSHIIWFEDKESTLIKSEYLLEKGIGSISYWAYGYY